MKKYLVLFVGLFFISCEGPVGPPGPPGPQGPSGAVGKAFKVKRVDFTWENKYSALFNIPDDIVVYESDLVMVYIKWVKNKETGNYIWRPLPATVYFKDGEMQYNFDYTINNVSIFLDGNISLETLGPDFTQNQMFKIVILPANYVKANKVNLKDAKAVMKLVDEKNIQRYKARELRSVKNK